METNEVTLKLQKPLKFEAAGQTLITTNKQLAMSLNDIFKPVFGDYFGSNISVKQAANVGYVIVPTMTFAVLPQYSEDKIYAFSPIMGQKNSDSIISRINKMANMGATGKTVTHTDEFKSMMKPFMMTANNRRTVNYADTINVTPGRNDTYIVQSCLNLTKLIQFMYGEKDEDGNDCVYQVTPTTIVSRPYNGPEEWGITITRLLSGSFNKSMELLGYGNVNITGGFVPQVVTECHNNI